MRRVAYLEHLSPWGKLLFLFATVVLSALVFSLFGLLVGKLLFNIDLASLANIISSPETDEHILFIKIYQVVNQVGAFILPALLFSFFVSRSSSSYLYLDKRPNLTNILVMGLMVFSILPFINYLGEINEKMVLPEAFSSMEMWMLEKELQAKELTEIFLQTRTISGLLVNLFIVALIPAIGEEILFRGLILKLFKEITGNIHLAVIISAVLFAAMHLQFYGFLPRFALGLLLGYAFVLTRNLWVPMFIHFVNNAASVVVYYLHYNGQLKVPMEDFGAVQNPVYIIGSLLITIWLMSIVYRREGHNSFSI